MLCIDRSAAGDAALPRPLAAGPMLKPRGRGHNIIYYRSCDSIMSSLNPSWVIDSLREYLIMGDEGLVT